MLSILVSLKQPNQRAEKGRSMRKMNSLHLSVVFCDASRSPRYGARAASPFERARTACFHLRLRARRRRCSSSSCSAGEGEGEGEKEKRRKRRGRKLNSVGRLCSARNRLQKLPTFFLSSVPTTVFVRLPSRRGPSPQPPLLLRPSPDEVFEFAPDRPKLDLI